MRNVSLIVSFWFTAGGEQTYSVYMYRMNKDNSVVLLLVTSFLCRRPVVAAAAVTCQDFVFRLQTSVLVLRGYLRLDRWVQSDGEKRFRPRAQQH